MTSPHHQDDCAALWHGDCRDILPLLPDSSVDAVVTDPPYELGFMGKAWDSTGIAFDPVVWQECLRVLKPGGHVLAFGGTRMWHRLACAIEDAGFEIRDSIAWLYGQGFPKSLDVSKAIDKAAGAERENYPDPKWLDRYPNGNGGNHNRGKGGIYGEAESVLGRPLTTSAPATPEAIQWQGWGTALKPGYEPIVMARKPFPGTVAGNVLAHGTGALNIDATRIGTDSTLRPNGPIGYHGGGTGGTGGSTSGRWPANVVLDESQAEALDEQSGNRKASGIYAGDGSRNGGGDWATSFKADHHRPNAMYADSGGASRFFYTAKASTRERPKIDGVSHSTVKPLALMRWLVRLVTPPGGKVLDPFVGSGTTMEAALLEGLLSVGIESGAEYLPLILHRLQRTPRTVPLI